MSINLEIGKYNENQESNGFQKMEFADVDEAIANIEFMKLGFNSFKTGDSLIVRVEPGTKPYLIDSDSTIPIIELKKELEQKYNSNEKESIFTVTDRKKEISLNSNFTFQEDENTKYAETTSGEKLPFKLFNSNDPQTRSNLLWESENSGQSSDFALIERRFAENKTLQLFGNEKIENHSDVAWLFKSLEDEAIEHAFLVYHFDDKGYFVQHISTGTFNQAIVDNKVLIGNILDAAPVAITLVHNHPSGVLKASKADSNCIENLKKALQYSDIEVNNGVIINLRSGKYLVFDENSFEKIEERSKNNSELKEIQPYSFSKQVFVENFQPITVKSSKEVAEFISSQKFGVSDKTELLVLNNQMHIVGKFLMPPQKQVDYIIGKITKFGGANCILYGNNITPQEINFYNDRLRFSNMSIVDGLLIQSENGKKIFKSFQDENLLDNKKISNEINISTNEPSQNLNNYKQSKKQENMENSFQITSYDENQAFLNMKQFSSHSETVKTLNNLEFADNKNHSLIDLKTGEVKYINNPADLQLAISDFWVKELSNRTDLSSGLSYDQIDGKQAEHFTNYEAELKSLLSDISNIEIQIQDTIKIENDQNRIVENTAVKFADYFLNDGNTNKLAEYKDYFQMINPTQKEIFLDIMGNHIQAESDNHEILSKLNVPKIIEQVKQLIVGNSEQINEFYQQIDLFPNHEFMPENLREVYDKWMEVENSKGLDYKDCEVFLKECESLGYTFEYQLDAQPIYLRPINIEDQLSLKDQIQAEIVGTITWHDSGEVMKYISQEKYLEALEKEFDSNPDRFNYETLLKEPELLKSVADLSYGLHGVDNPNSIDFYIEKVKKENNVEIIDEKTDNYKKAKDPDSNSLTSFGKDSDFIDDLFDDIENRNGDLWKKNDTEIIGGKIKDIAAEAIQNPEYLKQFDLNTQNTINQFIKSQNINNQNPKIMETQKDFDMVKHLQTQLKYLGFGEGEKLHKDLENGINSAAPAFEIKTSSDKALPNNNVDFTLNFNKSEKGGVFLNSYNANLSNEKSETITQKFNVSKENTFTAKEAINLLEGRTVKTEFLNPKTDQNESAFVKINFDEPKTEKGNYLFQSFTKNYGVDTAQIVEKSNLIFDKPEYRENTIKSLEKGNVVKVKFEIDDKIVEGKAVLNPQYKNLNLYDNDMNRINTNKPLVGLDNDNKHEKSNVREQSHSRGH